MQASRAFDLPCPWVPLQSMTAAASREFPSRSNVRWICGAKSPSDSSRSTAHPVSGHTPEGVRAESSSSRGASPERWRSRIAPSGGFALSRASAEAGVRFGTQSAATWQSRTGAEASVRLGTRSHDGAHANTLTGSFTQSRAEARVRVLPHRFDFGRSRALDGGAILLGAIGRSRLRPPGYPRFRGTDWTYRSGSNRAPRSRELPPTLEPPKRIGGARHAAWEFDDNSHGVRVLPAFEPGRSLCRFASSAPSALRVFHPLSGFIPPGPRGFVSRHIRP
jgi:hypothetical protein